LLLSLPALEEEVQVAIQTNTGMALPTAHKANSQARRRKTQRFLGNTRTKHKQAQGKPNIAIYCGGKHSRLRMVAKSEGQESGADFRCIEMSLVQSNGGKCVPAL
jgi:hypothetical protein